MIIIRNIIVLVWLLLQYGNSHAQYDKNWVFGKSCHLIFEDDTVIQSKSNANYNFWDELSFSDLNGILKFYISTTASDTLGTTIPAGYDRYSANIEVIGNNDEIISLPLDVTFNKFFFNVISIKQNPIILFKKQTASCTSNFNQCATIRQKSAIINLDSNRIMPFFELSDSVVFNSDVVKHANGKDWWLLGHLHPLSGGGLSNNTYYRLLIKEDGSLDGPYYQNIGSTWRNNKDIFGPIKFSKNGKYLAVGKLHTRMIEVFDFDRCTGLLSNTQLVDFGYPIMPISLEFSPNEKFLYVIQNKLYNFSDTTAVYQYDIEKSISNNKTVLAFKYIDNSGTFNSISLSLNNNIYISNRSTYSIGSKYYDSSFVYTTLSVINYPDSAGLACGFEAYSFPLRDSCYASYGLPNYPNFNLEALSIYEADAGTDTVICTDSTNNQKVVTIGSPKVNGVEYQWYPNYNLSSDTASQVLAYPDSSTIYYLMLSDTSIKNACKTRLDSVLVEVKNCVTGINDPQTPKGGLRVYPNPASQEINLSINNLQSSIKEVKVYDVAGRIVHSQLPIAIGTAVHSSITKINVGGLEEGLYFLEVGLSNGESARAKFIKQ